MSCNLELSNKWTRCNEKNASYITIYIIIHQTHYEESDWSRAFSQFTIACELDMINAISVQRRPGY